MSKLTKHISRNTIKWGHGNGGYTPEGFFGLFSDDFYFSGEYNWKYGSGYEEASFFVGNGYNYYDYSLMVKIV